MPYLPLTTALVWSRCGLGIVPSPTTVTRPAEYDCSVEHNEARNTPALTAHAVFEPELRNPTRAIARSNDRTVAAEIRRAIREHVKREQRKETQP
jgi:hypothetical protein